ncbi:uncharacterized protein LOC124435755 isoform X2 [Xenia sp. Carnegie-2017]|uniref:uncharacterized protein LOC124435755 isoform X2 n=1 Tax=Xenia sp. Carnegie-2017 TaxID=2897299 RepID=UPI001F040812|nr:uncharacterized protein LOC124435755 isoform X2 [Xenia sp. Carnegie-2017]
MFYTKILITLLLNEVLVSEMLTSRVEWPLGSYTLPKPKSGCPNTASLTWKEAWRFQDLENDARQESNFSTHFHMDANLRNNDIKRSFCTSLNENVLEPWPKGSYCIYRNSNYCPPDMKEGYIEFFDEQTNNSNKIHNYFYLPDGLYFGPFTRLLFCCKTAGSWYQSIELPTENPFYLMPYGSQNCQRVKGAISSLEHIIYDTEDNQNWDEYTGAHAHLEELSQSLLKVYYCYYEGCQHDLRRENGSFSSTNFANNSYPNFQQCSWSINVNSSRHILLEFLTLHIPNCHENYLDIYEGNNTLVQAVRFCGANATSGVKYESATNHLIIFLQSGNNSAFGNTLKFHAKYETFSKESSLASENMSSTTAFLSPTVLSENTSTGRVPSSDTSTQLKTTSYTLKTRHSTENQSRTSTFWSPTMLSKETTSSRVPSGDTSTKLQNTFPDLDTRIPAIPSSSVRNQIKKTTQDYRSTTEKNYVLDKKFHFSLERKTIYIIVGTCSLLALFLIVVTGVLCIWNGRKKKRCFHLHHKNKCQNSIQYV